MSSPPCPKLFAFWNYSFGTHTGFEGVLGAEIESMDDEGIVKPKGYGGHRFMPVKILPLKAGKELYAKIEKLRKEYHAAITGVNAEYKARFDMLFPR